MQSTASIEREPSMSLGVDQLRAVVDGGIAAVSTATQKLVLTQLTASRVRVESASEGVDQLVPLYTVA